MTSGEAYGRLARFGRPVVETREAAALLGVSVSSASHLLRSPAGSGLARRLHRGVWAVGAAADPRVLAPYLTSPYPGYVSLWSALAYHGMVDQIPAQTFVASLGRTRTISTPSGSFSIHHLTPELFGGFTGDPDHGFLATPEKALFDVVYVRAPRGGRVYFPEIELSADFDYPALEAWIARVPNAKIRTVVRREIERTLGVVTG